MQICVRGRNGFVVTAINAQPPLSHAAIPPEELPLLDAHDKEDLEARVMTKIGNFELTLTV